MVFVIGKIEFILCYIEMSIMINSMTEIVQQNVNTILNFNVSNKKMQSIFSIHSQHGTNIFQYHKI